MDESTIEIQDKNSQKTNTLRCDLVLPSKAKISMSVKEMREMLGLKKVESYWLVQKGLFETRDASGVMRIMVNSFEEWYSHQFHYRKVNGDPPGAAFGKILSDDDIARILGLNQRTAFSLIINTPDLHHIRDGREIRVRETDFENWYKSQFRYKKVDGEIPGSQFEKTISVQEMSDLLGIPLRNTGYYLCSKGLFSTFKVKGQLRVDVNSFEKWYKTQSHYKKITKKEDL